MGKISQANANSAATKVVEPINKKIQKVNKEIKEFVTECQRLTVPLEMMKMWKKFPAYINSGTNVYVKGICITNKYNFEYIDNSPRNLTCTPDLNLTKEQAAKYVKLIDQRDELTEKLKNTHREIEQTILTLGTVKRVVEAIPELADYFPESVKQTMMLAIQLDPIREKIKCLVSTDVEKKCIEKI